VLHSTAGLPRLTPHGLRRCANSAWFAADVDRAIRDAWGGWSDDSMADGTYLRIGPEVHKAAAALVAAYRAANGRAGSALVRPQ
jgi:integrase